MGALRGVDRHIEGPPRAQIRGRTPLSGADPSPIGLQDAPVGGTGGGLGCSRGPGAAAVARKHPVGSRRGPRGGCRHPSGGLEPVPTPRFAAPGDPSGVGEAPWSTGAGVIVVDPPGATASNTPQHGENTPEHSSIHHRKHLLSSGLFDERRPGRRRARRRHRKPVGVRAVHRPNTGCASSNITAHAAAPTLHRRNTGYPSPMHVRQRIGTTYTALHTGVSRRAQTMSGRVRAVPGRASRGFPTYTEDVTGNTTIRKST